MVPFSRLQQIFIVMVSFLGAGNLMAQNELSTNIRKAAITFIAGLSTQQQDSCMFSFEDRNRTNWNYLPGMRKGLAMKNINDVQKKELMSMLDVLLSEQGLQKTENIMALEAVLRSVEGRPESDTYRDPGKYAIAFYGKPSETQPWFFRFEGHHVSLNFTINGNSVDFTPNFFGANPAIVPSGPHKEWEVLKDEQDMARALIRNLSAEQQNKAIISREAPYDIITARDRKITIHKFEGIPAYALTPEQRKMLFNLIDLYLNRMDESLAEKERREIMNWGLDNIYFAWAGGIEKGEKHYYKIQSPALLIEYDNSQNGGNHIHTVIRDSNSDFGEDILSDHYKMEDHHE